MIYLPLTLSHLNNPHFTGPLPSIGIIPAGPALLYLYRRFGPTEYGSDPYKAVCNYEFPTAIPGLNLGIRIGGLKAALYTTATDEVEARFYISEAWRGGDGKFEQECVAAVEAALRDLLPPVAVQDVYITLFGEATPDELGEWLETEHRYANEAPPFARAGDGYLCLAASEAPNAHP